MEETQFKGEQQNTSIEYVPYTPASVKVLSITSGFSLPLLPPEVGGPTTKTYSVGTTSIKATLKLSNADGTITTETPLAMCHYVKPSGDSVYDIDVCRETSMANIAREQHNKFIVELLNEFITTNDLGTSAGKLTSPEAPVDFSKLRLTEIKKLFTDKINVPRKAIKFLAEREFYCGRDYEFDDAFEKANQVCFEEICRDRPRKAPNGQVRVRLEGCPPSWWDGKSERDSAGHYVSWAMGDGHTFLTPTVVVVRAPEPPQSLMPCVTDSEHDEGYEIPSSFEELALPSVPSVPLIENCTDDKTTA